MAWTQVGTFHGELRWAFVLLAVVGLGRTIYARVRVRPYGSLDKRLAQLYSLGLDLQILLGVGLLIYLTLDRLELGLALEWIGWHPLWALATALVSHLGRHWQAAPAPRRLEVQLGVYGVSLILIILSGLTSPLRGWMRP